MKRRAKRILYQTLTALAALVVLTIIGGVIVSFVLMAYYSFR